MPRSAERAVRETSAGGVVFRCTEAGPQYLLINDAYKNWGFPKGHVQDDETPAEAAQRETREETGLEMLIPRGTLGVVDWYFRFRGKLIHKFCHFFLFESPSGTPVPQVEEGITECRWYTYADAVERIGYDNARRVLMRAAECLPDPCPTHPRDGG